jgi:hypothetical protein
MPRTLVVTAYHFPPENVIGAARPARFVKYLTRSGWNIQVVTAAPASPGNNYLVHSVEDRSRDFFSSSESEAITLPPWQRYSELFLRKFIFPGAPGLTWALTASRLSRNILEPANPKPCAVLSTFPPLAAHLAGWALARDLQVPWIADFRDPFLLDQAGLLSRISYFSASRLESVFFREAAAIITNTEALADLYRHRYPKSAHKVSVIWNGFDPETAHGPLPLPKRSRRVLSHVGVLYGGRNPVALIESFERLVAAGHPLASQWQIKLAGPFFGNDEDQRCIERGVQQGFVTTDFRSIPQAEALKMSQESDGLLLLQPQSRVQVPGKLFEYINYGRPILSLSPAGSAVDWLLAKCGIPYLNMQPEEPQAVSDSKLTQYLALTSDPSSPSPWYVENFNAEHQARQLSTILEKVI